MNAGQLSEGVRARYASFPAAVRDACASSDAWIVGGTIRDVAAGIDTIDIDLACHDARRLASAIARRVQGSLVVLDGDRGIFRIVASRDCQFDIAELHGAGIEDDLLRRDFTVNALAWHCGTSRLVDITGGVDDVRDGIVRMVDRRNLHDDPVRLVRAFRIAALLGFSISDETLDAVGQLAPLIRQPARERIKEELFKLLGTGRAAGACRVMARAGLLAHLFPAIGSLPDAAGCTHPGDATLEIAFRCMEALEQTDLFERFGCPQDTADGEAEQYAGYRRLSVLAALLLPVANLFANAGKDATVSGYEHEVLGARFLGSVCRDMKFAVSSERFVSTLVRSVVQLIRSVRDRKAFDAPSYRSIRDDLGARAPFAFALAAAGCCEASGDAVAAIHRRYLSYQTTDESSPPLLDGSDIMGILGIAGGPQVGRLIASLRDEQLEGRIRSVESARCWILGQPGGRGL